MEEDDNMEEKRKGKETNSLIYSWCVAELARGFYPRCLAGANIACDVDEVLWPAPDQRRDDAGAE